MILEKNLNGEKIAAVIEHYCSDKKALNLLSSKSAAHGKTGAAELIVDDCYRLLACGE